MASSSSFKLAPASPSAQKSAMAEKALALLRSRLRDQSFAHGVFKSSPDSNYSKLKFLISTSIAEGCNNSVLLLGPRGSGKISVVELVLADLSAEYPDMLSVIRLNGLLHSDDNCGLKEIARQLCLEHQLLFSKMASSDDNSQFMLDMLRECGLAHKTLIFLLDEFDLFAQGKQRLLYSLLDAMQTLSSQAVAIGVSCRLDADQLLEKRVRSRFSHRKLLFVPLTTEDLKVFLNHALYLPEDSSFSSNYVKEFNSRVKIILGDKKFNEALNSLSNVDGTIGNILRFLYQAVSYMDLASGLLTLQNFKNALLCFQKQPKLDIVKDASVLELYILVCMNRLETKEQNTYNFNSILKEYKAIHEAYKTSDHYGRTVCSRAYEHLLEQELICFVDGKGRHLSNECRPVKLLVSFSELCHGLKSNTSCPAILQKLLDHESFK
ncbi:origin recognition complex subunit 4 protein [Dioscorea alata]|uniref:Origin recognition complex subunit 4 protein n=2 Tax=Dioscorea alata TaxID=55571 RepID=A0ACB7UAB3_DIOAL|nr:origin recognition complex subunit 4 protein [Dioscorea alata]